MTIHELDGYLRSLSSQELSNLTSLVAMHELPTLYKLRSEAINSGNEPAGQYMEAACDLRRISELPLLPPEETK